jgi:acetyl esterase/lipase
MIWSKVTSPSKNQIHDVAAMLVYLHKHANEFDLVANDDWFISGDSAGGHLALDLGRSELQSFNGRPPRYRPDWREFQGGL